MVFWSVGTSAFVPSRLIWDVGPTGYFGPAPGEIHGVVANQGND